MNMIGMLLIIISCILLIVIFLNEYYRRVVIRNEQEAHIKRGRLKDNKYDIVAFGSSYGRYAFDFSDSGLKGYNFGFVAQFFYYTDKMIRAFSSTFEEECTVVITIPALCFAEVGHGMYHPQRYVVFLNKRELGDEFSIKNYLLYNYFPLFIHPRGNTKKAINYLIGINKNDEYSKLLTNQLSIEEVSKCAVQRTKGWISQFGLRDTQTDEISEVLEEKFKQSRAILTSSIEYCLDKGYKPVLVVPPVSQSLNKLLSDRFLDKVLYENIKLANVQLVPCFDFLRDTRFQSEELYSNNSDFLNARGRKMFTKAFLSDLNRINYV